jgi:hypothetical protein
VGAHARRLFPGKRRRLVVESRHRIAREPLADILQADHGYDSAEVGGGQPGAAPQPRAPAANSSGRVQCPMLPVSKARMHLLPPLAACLQASALAEFLTPLLCYQPWDRPSAQEALQHAWLAAESSKQGSGQQAEQGEGPAPPADS